jgi:hypothetical protein
MFMDPAKEQMFRNYAWAYFAFHAEQRMKTFNFFLVGAGILATAIATLVRAGGNPLWVCPLGLLLTCLSFIFWKLDRRNRALVKNGEAALKHLDSLLELPKLDDGPHVLKIFDRDDHYSEKMSQLSILQSHFSYTKCLEIVFALFALLGIYFAFGVFILKHNDIC